MLCDLDLRRSNDSSNTNHLQGAGQFTIKAQADASAFSQPLVKTAVMIASRFRTVSVICRKDCSLQEIE